MISTGEQRTALYRFYDADVKLLYVGITNDPWRRWREHVLAQPWYPEVKHQAVTWYDYKFLAERAERAAIRTEHPRFNVAGADEPDPEAVAEPAPTPVPRLELPPAVQPEMHADPVPGPTLEPPRAAVPSPELIEADRLPETAPVGGQADPLLHTRRGRRILLTVLTCIAWALLPSFPGMPKDWHSPWMISLVASTPIPVIVFFLIAFAPKLHRIGRWLDTNFGPPRESCE